MAYNDDAVLSKLSVLNESHESIATAAQWIMFHRRYSERTVQIWFSKLKDLPSPKRLNMIYLANEVVQQSKARHKDDFLQAFTPCIAEATALAYKGASSEIQSKLKRVVDVWKERGIFEPSVQEAVEARLAELDEARNMPKVGGTGSAMFGSAAVPSELSPLVPPQQRLSKLLHPMKLAVQIASSEHDKLTDPANTIPAPPVYAARLNGLIKSLANAEGAVTECLKARKELIGALEKILSSNKEAIEAEENQLREVISRKASTEAKKQEVETAIIRGLASEKEQSPHALAGGSGAEPERPEVEALTPPPVQNSNDFYDNSPHQNGHDQQSTGTSDTMPEQPDFHAAPDLHVLSDAAARYPAIPVNGANKKRKIDAAQDDFPDLGGDDGIDADVAELLRQDSK